MARSTSACRRSSSWQTTLRNSTRFRWFQTPSSGFSSGAYAGSCSSHRRGAAPAARNSFTTRLRCVGRPSQTTSSGPGIWSNNCCRKQTMAGPYSSPVGVMPLITERWSQVSHSRKTGVCPLGAQVRTTEGRGRKPDSSTKRIVRPSARAFFQHPANALLPRRGWPPRPVAWRVA